MKTRKTVFEWIYDELDGRMGKSTRNKANIEGRNATLVVVWLLRRKFQKLGLPIHTLTIDESDQLLVRVEFPEYHTKYGLEVHDFTTHAVVVYDEADVNMNEAVKKFCQRVATKKRFPRTS